MLFNIVKINLSYSLFINWNFNLAFIFAVLTDNCSQIMFKNLVYSKWYVLFNFIITQIFQNLIPPRGGIVDLNFIITNLLTNEGNSKRYNQFFNSICYAALICLRYRGDIGLIRDT